MFCSHSTSVILCRACTRHVKQALRSTVGLLLHRRCATHHALAAAHLRHFLLLGGLVLRLLLLEPAATDPSMPAVRLAGNDGTGFRVLAAAPADVLPADRSSRLKLVFAPSTAAERQRELLALVQGRIVGEANSVGAYTVQLAMTAEAGSVDAQVAVGTAHYLGRGAPKDLGRAAHWFREAAKGGDVGSQYTPAAGWAQSITYHRDTLGDASYAGCMSVALGGDASVATSGFWASLTMATTLKLPMLFYIEDNDLGISVRGDMQTPGGDIARNLASFTNLFIRNGSGTDPHEAAGLLQEAVAHVRRGEGPALVRLTVPRLCRLQHGHGARALQACPTTACGT